VAVTSGGASERRWAAAGSLSVELAVLAPVLVLFAVLMAAVGRVETAQAQVAGAARAGAEAAAEAADPGQAVIAARAAVTGSLSPGGLCRQRRLTVSVAGFVAGGQVTVGLACTVRLADLGVPGLPGTVVLAHRVTAPIDPYRVVP
jgi:Flp pilus assembly protein TadG